MSLGCSDVLPFDYLLASGKEQRKGIFNIHSLVSVICNELVVFIDRILYIIDSKRHFSILFTEICVLAISGMS